MYEKALDWKHMNHPDEAEGKWISLLKFGEEWNM
jgi:hypothetical protein